MYLQPQRPANFGRFVFLDPRARTFYRDWADAAQQTVALLRTEAGRAPHDRAPHDRALTDLDLSYEAMGLTSDRDLLFMAYTAAPGSPSDDALRVLMSWAATHEQEARISPPE